MDNFCGGKKIIILNGMEDSLLAKEKAIEVTKNLLYICFYRMRDATILLILTLLIGCKSEIDNFLKNYPSALSPDKKVVVYQTSFEENGAYRVSLGTWIESTLATGGAGIFDIQVDAVKNLKFYWTSDTTIKVIYPSSAKVLRQEKQSYFAGRTVHISYEIAH